MKTNLKKISQLYTNMTLPVKASMWYLACSVLQKAIGFLTTPIFTESYGNKRFWSCFNVQFMGGHSYCPLHTLFI